MGRFQSQMREARRKLHDYLHVPALYFPWPLGATVPRLVTVRVHERFLSLGDLAGANFHYAERRDSSPSAIFLRSEVDPVRGMLISLEPGVAYRLDAVDPPDDITVTARIVRLGAKDLVGLPLPPQAYVGMAAIYPAFGAATP